MTTTTTTTDARKRNDQSIPTLHTALSDMEKASDGMEYAGQRAAVHWLFALELGKNGLATTNGIKPIKLPHSDVYLRDASDAKSKEVTKEVTERAVTAFQSVVDRIERIKKGGNDDDSNDVYTPERERLEKTLESAKSNARTTFRMAVALYHLGVTTLDYKEDTRTKKTVFHIATDILERDFTPRDGKGNPIKGEFSRRIRDAAPVNGVTLKFYDDADRGYRIKMTLKNVISIAETVAGKGRKKVTPSDTARKLSDTSLGLTAMFSALTASKEGEGGNRLYRTDSDGRIIMAPAIRDHYEANANALALFFEMGIAFGVFDCSDEIAECDAPMLRQMYDSFKAGDGWDPVKRKPMTKTVNRATDKGESH